MYFIAFRVYLLRKTRKNPGRNKDSGNKDLGRNRGRRTEYTPLFCVFATCLFIQCGYIRTRIQIYSVKKSRRLRRLDFSKFSKFAWKNTENQCVSIKPFSWLELDSDSTRIRPIFSPNSTRIRQTRPFFEVESWLGFDLNSQVSKKKKSESTRLDFFPDSFHP